MFDKTYFQDLAGQLTAVLPESFSEASQEIQKQFSHRLQEAFKGLDLVTREEFEAQRKVLARTREKVEALEKRLADQ